MSARARRVRRLVDGVVGALTHPEMEKALRQVRAAAGRHAGRTEVSWQRSAVAYCEEYDCIVRRLDSLGRRGKTDLLVVTPNGYCWFPELKRDYKAKESKLQSIERAELKKRFQIADRIDSLAQFKDRLHEVLNLPFRGEPL